MAIPLSDRLRPELDEDTEEPSPDEVEHAQRMMGSFPLVESAYSDLDARVREETEWDPHARAVVRGTIASLRAHSKAIQLLIEQSLWVPALCTLRAYIEAAASLAKLWPEPYDLAVEVMEGKRIQVGPRLRELGWIRLHQEAYGPLSTIAHHGYTAVSSQVHSMMTSVEDPMPEIHPDSDHHLFLFGSTGVVLSFRPMPWSIAYARYVPALTTIMVDLADCLARRMDLHSTESTLELEKWLTTHGDLSCRVLGPAIESE